MVNAKTVHDALGEAMAYWNSGRPDLAEVVLDEADRRFAEAAPNVASPPPVVAIPVGSPCFSTE